MSRAFLKEDALDEPVLIPPRAPLPTGVVNYVTPRGLRLLKTELRELELKREKVQSSRGDDSDRTRQLTIIRGRTQDLRARIAGAKVLDPRQQPEDEVRFGASVTMQTCDGKHPGEERRISIVGVDEADATEGRVAFVAPIALSLLGRKVGERTTLRAPHGEEILEIIEIAYALE